MIRVLFVDDDADLLSGLRRAFRPCRDRWEMTFVADGPTALVTLAESTFDVVVSDMLMPVMSGSALLSEVRSQHPSMIRIMLSGQTSLGDTSRDRTCAHQFLAKPCDARTLQVSIDRAVKLRAQLSDPDLIGLVGGIECLPSPSPTLAALGVELAREHIDVDRVASIVAGDPAVSAKVLQIVNSAYFGMPNGMSDPRQAVVYLGARALGELGMSIAAISAVQSKNGGTDAALRALHDAAHRRADLAASFAQRAGQPSQSCRDVWTAAFLADIGDLLVLSLREEVRERAATSASTLGAYLLAMWGLPAVLVAVAGLSRDRPEVFAPDAITYTWLARQGDLAASGRSVLSVEELSAAGLDADAVYATASPHEPGVAP